jgi:hypothetical protein
LPVEELKESNPVLSARAIEADEPAIVTRSRLAETDLTES